MENLGVGGQFLDISSLVPLPTVIDPYLELTYGQNMLSDITTPWDQLPDVVEWKYIGKLYNLLQLTYQETLSYWREGYSEMINIPLRKTMNELVADKVLHLMANNLHPSRASNPSSDEADWSTLKHIAERQQLFDPQVTTFDPGGRHALPDILLDSYLDVNFHGLWNDVTDLWCYEDPPI